MSLNAAIDITVSTQRPCTRCPYYHHDTKIPAVLSDHVDYHKRFYSNNANRDLAGGVPLRLRYPILQYIPCSEVYPIRNQEHSWPQLRYINSLDGYLVRYAAALPVDREAERHNRGTGASAAGDWGRLRPGEEGE